MFSTRWLFQILIIIILTGCAGPQPAPAPPEKKPTIRYFEESGYTVRGDFLRFFEIYGGPASLGLPLTEELVVDGWKVQYFEKGRLEYHPENEATYRITVGWLGDLMHRRRPPIPPGYIPAANNPDRRYFPDTGHTVSGDFLRYFETHGGKVRFGWPISEPFLSGGRLTQDFQSARFFWTPDQEPPVTLEDIGRLHLEMTGLTSKK